MHNTSYPLGGKVSFIKGVGTVLGMVVWLASVTQAVATTDFLFTVEPAYQQVIVEEEDRVVQAEIRLHNGSVLPQEVELFSFGFTQHDHFGSISLIDEIAQSGQHPLSPYLSFDADRFIIPAKDSRTVRINIQNRESLSPGGHYVAVVARVQTETQQEGQPVLPAVASFLLIRKVGGERLNLSLSSIDWEPHTVVLRLPTRMGLLFRNGGNTHLIPRGLITMTDGFGRVVKKGTINEQSHIILPENSRNIFVHLKDIRSVLPIQFISLKAEGISDIGEIPFQYESSFIYIHYGVILAIIGVLLFVGSYKYRHFIRKK